VTKTYSMRLGTRITENVDTRPGQLARIRRWRLSHVLNDVVNGALLATEDLAAQMSRLTKPGREACHGSS
jgi:hypothetical protein